MRKTPIPSYDLFTGEETVIAPRSRARRTDPWTSHAAANSADKSAKLQRDLIIRALTKAHRGLTNDELDLFYQWRAGTASRRTGELVEAGRVVRDAAAVRKTRTGQPALINRLSGGGK